MKKGKGPYRRRIQTLRKQFNRQLSERIGAIIPDCRDLCRQSINDCLDCLKCNSGVKKTGPDNNHSPGLRGESGG